MNTLMYKSFKNFKQITNNNNKNLLSFTKTSYKNFANFSISYINDSSNISKQELENRINIYTAPEWNEMNKYLTDLNYFNITPKNDTAVNTMYDIYTECVFNTSFKSKYFALLPFFAEDKFTREAKKKFLVEMSLLPDSGFLYCRAAMASGIHTFLEPLEDIVPLPAEDYRYRHRISRSRPASFMDTDMFYGNRKSLNILCFDKKGTWHEEGVNHPKLNVSESYKENNWFDHLRWETHWY